jgi:hypothetical protein
MSWDDGDGGGGRSEGKLKAKQVFRAHVADGQMVRLRFLVDWLVGWLVLDTLLKCFGT